MEEAERLAKLSHDVEILLRRVAIDMHDVDQLYAKAPMNDARRTALHVFANSIFPIHMGCLFICEQLLDAAWWIKPGRSLYGPEGVAILLEEFENNLKFGLLIRSFMATESTFRAVSSALFVSNLTRHVAFKQVSNRLIRALSLPSATALETLEFYRLLRNTLHTNTVHTGGDVGATWRGRTFQFRESRRIDFLTWDVLTELVDDIRILVGCP